MASRSKSDEVAFMKIVSLQLWDQRGVDKRPIVDFCNGNATILSLPIAKLKILKKTP